MTTATDFVELPVLREAFEKEFPDKSVRLQILRQHAVTKFTEFRFVMKRKNLYWHGQYDFTYTQLYLFDDALELLPLLKRCAKEFSDEVDGRLGVAR